VHCSLREYNLILDLLYFSFVKAGPMFLVPISQINIVVKVNLILGDEASKLKIMLWFPFVLFEFVKVFVHVELLWEGLDKVLQSTLLVEPVKNYNEGLRQDYQSSASSSLNFLLAFSTEIKCRF
jgi:hypothetical protein